MNLQRREEFLTFACIFMGGLLLLTWGLGSVADVNPMKMLRWNTTDVGIGVAAGFGMMVVFGLVPSLRSQAEDALGEALAGCRWYDFIPLAIFVGIIEELLFRGVLEPWVARWSPLLALIAVNALFGLLHSVSWTYGLAAFSLGCLLSLLAHGWETPNLLRPIVAHAVYDYIGFLLIAASYRHSLPPDLPPASDESSHDVH